MQRQSNFVPTVIDWLQQTEKLLEPLRSYLVSRLASFRGQLIAMEDGLLSEHVQHQQRSTRKKQSAFAHHILSVVEEEMREEIKKIDIYFEELSDKLSQLIAIVSSKSPLPYSAHLTTEYLDKIWALLHANEQTQSMSAYILARSDLTDRRFLLQGLMSNFLEQTLKPA